MSGSYFKGHAVLEVRRGLSKSSRGPDPGILPDAPVGRGDGREGEEQQRPGYCSHCTRGLGVAFGMLWQFIPQRARR